MAQKENSESPYSGIDLTELTDEQLVDICNQELPETTRAYCVLIRRYEGLIYNTCLKLLGNQQDAEEVAQDTLIQLFHKLYQFQGRSTFKTWLYRIVHNYCKNRISKQIRQRKGQSAIEEHASHFSADAFDETENNEHKLKPRDKEIIVLKYMSGLTMEEMSDVLDIGLSACKMRLYRALDTFKETYQRVIKESPKPFISS